MQIGAFDYVTKPISDYEALNLKVENAIEKVQDEAPPARARGAARRERGAAPRRVRDLDATPCSSSTPTTGALEDANPAAERLYGRTRDELRRCRYDGPPRRRSRTAGGRRAGSRAFPARHRRADGFTFPVEISAGELRLADGRPARAVGPRRLGARARRARAARPRAEPPPGAEDGGGGAARRRRRPRLLERPRGGPRLLGPAPARPAARRRRACASAPTGSSRPRTARWA